MWRQRPHFLYQKDGRLLENLVVARPATDLKAFTESGSEVQCSNRQLSRILSHILFSKYFF